MERRRDAVLSSSIIFSTFLLAALTPLSGAEVKGSFDDNFSKTCPDTHFKTSEDGQIWHLSLDKEAGCGFVTKQSYRFGWFSMKLKLVGGDSAGVVTAFYMCTDFDAGIHRDEVDIEFLGNRTGQPYILQTNVYKNGTGNREMRHVLWFDPTEDFHTYSILWNSHQLVIWNADDWATRGGLEKTDWKKSPFVSSYTDFNVEGCEWKDPYPACVSTTTENWWDQYDAWHLSDEQKLDYTWVERNLVIYDYCKDTDRFPKLPEECWLSPLA